MKKHGMCNTRLYTIWRRMKQRCNRKEEEGYENYGGRGIKVCDEWQKDFLSFYEWAINNGYNDSLSIDRINSNGNYEPSNCRWATMKTQQNNKRTTTYVTIDGVTKPATEWAELTGISAETIRNRYNQFGDNKDLVFNKERVQEGKHGLIYIDGEYDTITGWAKRAGISKQTMHVRIKNGWTGKRLLLPTR